ncbi:MAG: UDP-N-acetylmuramoyl-L-alanyl-D-glutamate--2,6-diaminopimelate ligase [Armatimonadetes bacterium]|nr:UDP-N-acetylmuramoyl-L-alanyl-D-glutamate--2,6-diaminopimelate ligase [Armatimonadota bacterium]
MNLSELSQHIPNGRRIGDDVAIESLAYDSRQVTPGALFVALRGAKSDGHDFIPQAMNGGAAALCVNADCAGWYGARGVPALIVPDTRLALPILAARFYGEPSRALDLIGVTGTNGKTTTTYMIESILRTWGERTGLIGTVGALINGKSVPLERTTPESADLQRLFTEMRGQGVKRVVMEVSSQGILAHRTEGCAFDTGVWTNLTQDHLDAHGTMEAYFAEKLRLFTEYPNAFPDKPFAGVINADDDYGRRVAEVLEAAGRPVLRYALHDPDAPLRAEVQEVRPDGTDFTVHYQPPHGSPVTFPIALRMGGLFNVANALAAVGVALQRRVPPGAIKNGLEALTGVPGRFELIDTRGRGFYVVVDYAHSPDGLENVLLSARKLNPTRLLCVFGCGGDRDRRKRPQMGRISAELADLTVITSDNPRSEHPDAIIADILAGIEGGAKNPNVVVEADRHLAIQRTVCELACPGDMVVIAGKGHETGQQFADHKIPFDDRQVAREALAQCA